MNHKMTRLNDPWQTEPAQVPKARRIKDACRALGIGRTTLYRLAGEGKIKIVHIGNRAVVPETEIDRLASEGTS